MWEYKTLRWSPSVDPVDSLNELGRQGWEAFHLSDSGVVLLKRAMGGVDDL